MDIKYYLDKGGHAPEKAHESDAGFDLRTPFSFYVEPHKSEVIDTKVHTLIPDGYVGMLKSKSGLNVRFGIEGEGVIDAGYTGSIVAKLYNNSDERREFKKGDKIIQLVILPIPSVSMVEVDNFDDVDSERGTNGFGSSGR